MAVVRSTSITTCDSNSSFHNVNKLVSDRHKEIITLVNCTVLCNVIAVFGIITNTINLIIFCKQGLDTTINTSLFCLAISDLSCMLLQVSFNVYINPWFQDLKLSIVYADIQYLTTALYRGTFARITCLITVYITAERCLCIVFPLHIKQLITPRKTTAVLVLIYTISLLSPIPLFCTSYLNWKFYPNKNISILGMSFTSMNDTVEKAEYFMHAVILLLSFCGVVFFTLITTYKLQHKNAWRQDASTSPGKAPPVSKRDRSTIAMVIVIATILIVCYSPSCVAAMVTFFEPEFCIGGRYYNLYYSVWTFAQLQECVNSSVNIFLYFKMSTKYRHTFMELFSRCKCSDMDVSK